MLRIWVSIASLYSATLLISYENVHITAETLKVATVQVDGAPSNGGTFLSLPALLFVSTAKLTALRTARAMMMVQS